VTRRVATPVTAILLTFVTPLLVPILLLGLSTGNANALTNGLLPGGTPISVDNTSPANGSEFVVSGTTLDVTDAGQAKIGAGVPITLVYTLDTSGSMTLTAGVNCDGVAGNDTRLVCAQQGIATANAAAADPLSPIELAGLASFADGGATHDVNLLAGGVQLLVDPAFDGNGNGNPDVEDAAFALTAPLGGQTNFAAGLTSAFAILNDASNVNNSNIVLFLSDADAVSVMVGPNISTLAGSVPAGTTIHTFGMGSGTSCTFNGGTGTLSQIAALSTAGVGTCRVVTNIADLDDAIVAAIGSTLMSLEIRVDSGAFTPIPAGDIDIALPANGNFLAKTANYSTIVQDLPVGEHTICVRATGKDAGGTGSVMDCKTINLLKITLSPKTAGNELGTTGQTHTVTATILGDPDEVDGRLVTFTITAGPNAGATGVCSPNAGCTTNASGVVMWTYTATQGLAGAGTDTIQACFTVATPTGQTGCDTATKTWQDTTPPVVTCTQTTNPSGKNVPQAPGTGQNEDGFYVLTATDAVDPNPEVFLADTGSSAVFGPFESGVKIKLVQAPGATPSQKAGSGDIDWRITLKGDGSVYAIDASGNQSAPVSCLVPPKPK
jgi:hypothetical protein